MIKILVFISSSLVTLKFLVPNVHRNSLILSHLIFAGGRNREKAYLPMQIKSVKWHWYTVRFLSATKQCCAVNELYIASFVYLEL